MKVGEILTIERIIIGGTGYRYSPVRLTGEVALLNSEVVQIETEKCSAPEIQRFTFQFLRPGNAEIQLARFRSFELNDVLYEDVLPFYVEPLGDNNQIIGGWSAFAKLEPEDGVVFEKAMQGLIGVKYDPKRVSKQLVNGTNYRFFCYGESATQEKQEFPAIVKISATFGGDVLITGIERVVL